jgi:hypothetical protein
VTYSANKTPGQWKAHGHYIARESATHKEDIKSAGFSATEPTVNVSERLASWQATGDERLFKIIVSPEFGERMDLQEHTRALMKRIEKDLATRLEWVAVAHYNTEHPHVHIQRREVSQLRFTSLDRIILRNGFRQNNSLLVQKKAFEIGQPEFAREQGHYLIARFGKLEQLGLAEKTGRLTWRVRDDFESILRLAQQTTDRQKMLARHAALISDERLPLQITPLSTITILEGRVLGHGQEENTERPYLLLEGVEGKIHLISQNDEMQTARRNGQLRVNSFARFERQSDGDRAVLRIEDLGDSRSLLQNDDYLRKTASHLLRAGVLEIEPSWGGWLGTYQERLRTHLAGIRELQKLRSRDLGMGR